MSDTNGQPPPAPEPLLAGHLVILGLPDGTAMLLFRPDGGGLDATVQQPVPGFLAGPLVAALSGETPDLGGASPMSLMRRMVRGG